MERRITGDAGVVDQNINRTQIIVDLFHARCASVVVGDVPFVGFDTGFRRKGSRLFIVASIGGGNGITGIFQSG